MAIDFDLDQHDAADHIGRRIALAQFLDVVVALHAQTARCIEAADDDASTAFRQRLHRHRRTRNGHSGQQPVERRTHIESFTLARGDQLIDACALFVGTLRVQPRAKTVASSRRSKIQRYIVLTGIDSAAATWRLSISNASATANSTNASG